MTIEFKSQGRRLSAEEIACYEKDGFLIIRQFLSKDECDAFVQHNLDVREGRVPIQGFDKREPDDWYRIFQLHQADESWKNLLLHPDLGVMLSQLYGDDMEAIQTMYFFKGSEQGHHQDNFYLPGCVGVWLAFQDVTREIGALHVQRGSHKGPFISHIDRGAPHGQDAAYWGGYFEDVKKNFDQNGLEEVCCEINKGDIIIFHGRLIHRGGPILKAGSFRHSMANHYLPYSFVEGWPHEDWPRYSFDGRVRTAAMKNAPPEGRKMGLVARYPAASAAK